MASDYAEHLEIDFEDPEDTPPPWEVGGGVGEALEPQKGRRRRTTEAPVEDTDWVPEAVRDVAYYLRQHKFNEYDRRFHPGEYGGEVEVERGFVGGFPSPPLRTLHWEVRDVCDLGFLECLRYLQDKLAGVRLRRDDDTVTAMRSSVLSWPVNDTRHASEHASGTTNPPKDKFESMAEKWRYENEHQVNALDEICRGLKADDERDFQGFMGPIDRFQWRTTASYYMCYFTMRREPFLRALDEPCDNWAWCLDWKTGPSNQDPRADDGIPFGCAAYSFCPDPCCPLRAVRTMKECTESKTNPCRMATDGPEELEEAKRPQCTLQGDDNADFQRITQNHWNTTCPCAKQGLRWQSRFGFCVDVDECASENSCRIHSGEECVNTVGSFACRCRWGQTVLARGSRGPQESLAEGFPGACVQDPALRTALSARKGGAEVPSQQGQRGLWDLLENVLLPEK